MSASLRRHVYPLSIASFFAALFCAWGALLQDGLGGPCASILILAALALTGAALERLLAPPVGPSRLPKAVPLGLGLYHALLLPVLPSLADDLLVGTWHASLPRLLLGLVLAAIPTLPTAICLSRLWRGRPRAHGLPLAAALLGGCCWSGLFEAGRIGPMASSSALPSSQPSPSLPPRAMPSANHGDERKRARPSRSSRSWARWPPRPCWGSPWPRPFERFGPLAVLNL